MEGRQRFESLSAEFVELTVASTRKADHSKKTLRSPPGGPLQRNDRLLKRGARPFGKRGQAGDGLPGKRAAQCSSQRRSASAGGFAQRPSLQRASRSPPRGKMLPRPGQDGGNPFGEVRLLRDYYVATDGGSRVPLDESLGLIEGYSPGLAKMMARIAAQDSFEEGSKDLFAYAGVKVGPKAIARMAELVAPQMRAAHAVAKPEQNTAAIPVMYIEGDGTGVPVRKTRRGAAKPRTGRAKPKPVRSSSVAYLRRPRRTRKANPNGTTTPRPTWEPCNAARTSAPCCAGRLC